MREVERSFQEFVKLVSTYWNRKDMKDLVLALDDEDMTELYIEFLLKAVRTPVDFSHILFGLVDDLTRAMAIEAKDRAGEQDAGATDNFDGSEPPVAPKDTQAWADSLLASAAELSEVVKAGRKRKRSGSQTDAAERSGEGPSGSGTSKD